MKTADEINEAIKAPATPEEHLQEARVLTDKAIKAYRASAVAAIKNAEVLENTRLPDEAMVFDILPDGSNKTEDYLEE
jgi:hypothetical protein